jgi:hypothetical protein
MYRNTIWLPSRSVKRQVIAPASLVPDRHGETGQVVLRTDTQTRVSRRDRNDVPSMERLPSCSFRPVRAALDAVKTGRDADAPSRSPSVRPSACFEDTQFLNVPKHQHWLSEGGRTTCNALCGARVDVGKREFTDGRLPIMMHSRRVFLLRQTGLQRRLHRCQSPSYGDSRCRPANRISNAGWRWKDKHARAGWFAEGFRN